MEEKCEDRKTVLKPNHPGFLTNQGRGGRHVQNEEVMDVGYSISALTIAFNEGRKVDRRHGLRTTVQQSVKGKDDEEMKLIRCCKCYRAGHEF